MIAVRPKRIQPHIPSQEEELESRRVLMARARKGDRKAQRELMDLYGVRLYSEAERKRTKVVGVLASPKSKRARTR